MADPRDLAAARADAGRAVDEAQRYALDPHNPRDLAQRWLAEVLDRAGCADSAGYAWGHVDRLAAAILDQPGVTVTRIYRPAEGDSWIAVRLPAEPLAGDR